MVVGPIASEQLPGAKRKQASAVRNTSPRGMRTTDLVCRGRSEISRLGNLGIATTSTDQRPVRIMMLAGETIL